MKTLNLKKLIQETSRQGLYVSGEVSISDLWAEKIWNLKMSGFGLFLVNDVQTFPPTPLKHDEVGLTDVQRSETHEETIF